MFIIWLVIVALVAARFAYETVVFRRKLKTQENEEETPAEEQTESPSIMDGLEQTIEKGLLRIAEQGQARNTGSFLSLLNQYVITLSRKAPQLIKEAISYQSPQTLLLRKEEHAAYLLVMPYAGDRPHLIKQEESFSRGLRHHLDQIYARFGGKELPAELLIVAVFMKPGADKGILYAGYRNAGEYVLPMSLLSSTEMATGGVTPGDFRENI